MCAGMRGDVHRRLTQRRRRPANGDNLALCDCEDADQAGPGSGVGFGNRSEYFPRQFGLDGDHVRAGRLDELGVAAVDATAQAADQRHDSLTRRETPVRISPHQADAFDASDFRDIAPDALAEINLGMIEPEGFYLDRDVTGLRDWIGTLLDLQDFRPAIPLDHDCTHCRPAR